MVRLRNCVLALSVLAFMVGGSLVTPGLADGGKNHQTRNMHFGVSGGNVKDISKAFCCSGTLGSLVTDGTTQYILSNNHVLARSDQAVVGEDISQPGLIDNSCRTPPIVGDFTAAPALGSNVDAAIAQLRTGTMDSTGFIEDIGVPSSSIATPTVGMAVEKSGRTTGFTTGSISSVNTSVSVQYQKGCNSGKKFVISYSNQVVIDGSGFSAGGDSGSLILQTSGAHPVALLYAGSSTSTIGNPTGEVLSKLNALLGRSFSFVGTGGPNNTTTQILQSGAQPFLRGFGGQMRELPQQAADRASAVLETYRANLMATPGVIGAGVGASAENAAEAAIVIYVDRTSAARPQFAPSLEGIAVRVVYTDPFVAF